jgi:hypothetical protein
MVYYPPLFVVFCPPPVEESYRIKTSQSHTCFCFSLLRRFILVEEPQMPQASAPRYSGIH